MLPRPPPVHVALRPVSVETSRMTPSIRAGTNDRESPSRCPRGPVIAPILLSLRAPTAKAGILNCDLSYVGEHSLRVKLCRTAWPCICLLFDLMQDFGLSPLRATEGCGVFPSDV